MAQYAANHTRNFSLSAVGYFYVQVQNTTHESYGRTQHYIVGHMPFSIGRQFFFQQIVLFSRYKSNDKISSLM